MVLVGLTGQVARRVLRSGVVSSIQRGVYEKTGLLNHSGVNAAMIAGSDRARTGLMDIVDCDGAPVSTFNW